MIGMSKFKLFVGVDCVAHRVCRIILPQCNIPGKYNCRLDCLWHNSSVVTPEKLYIYELIHRGTAKMLRLKHIGLSLCQL